LEKAAKRCCYIKKNSMVATILATKFVERELPVKVRYFELISNQSYWTNNCKNHKFRFENHLDWDGINKFMEHPEPERMLWEHLKYMKENKSGLVSFEATRRLMKFDSDSRVTELPDVPSAVIEEHYARHMKGNKDYKGPTATSKNRGPGGASPRYSVGGIAEVNSGGEN
jgi:hypothetical protein